MNSRKPVAYKDPVADQLSEYRQAKRNQHGGPANGVIRQPGATGHFVHRGLTKEEEEKKSEGKIKKHFNLRDIEQMRYNEDNYAADKEANNLSLSLGKLALDYTNEFRRQNGLYPLQWNSRLAVIGEIHCRNMADGKVPVGHDGFHDRVKMFPFPARSFAENVAMNGGSMFPERTAVEGWINSPGHRKNLLSKNVLCGIGVARSFDGRYYFTQLFATV